MNIASIDVGSNTVILLIAEIDLEKKIINPILNRYSTPRISDQLTKTGVISLKSEQKLIDVLKEYREIIEDYSCETVFCTATKAMRSAANSKSIIERVEEQVGINITVISGEQEAKYSYLGAISDYSNKTKNIVIDIGGGSTEIILGKGKEIIESKSFNFGSVSLTEIFFKNSLPTKKETNQITKFIISQLNLYSNLFFEKCDKIIAVAGTPTTLSAINQNLIEYDERKINNSILSLNELNELTIKLSNMTPHQILKKHKSIVAGREDVITAGTIILKTILEKLNANNLIVSTKGLRYGVLVYNYFIN